MIRALLGLAAGAVAPLALAPFHLWPLAYLSLALLFYLLHTGATRGPSRLLLPWLYGVGLYLAGASWIYVSIHEHGNAAPPLAAVLVGLFVMGMALFYLLLGWLYSRLRSESPAVSAICFVVVVSFVQWLLTWLLTGFPWLFPGYALLDTPVAALAPVGGVLLLNMLLSAGAAALVVLALDVRRWRTATGAVALLVLLAPWLLGLVLSNVAWSDSTGARRAALVQGNIAQAEKWRPENRNAILSNYLELSAPHWGADLVLWPEAAITIFEHEAGTLLASLDARARAAGSALILGIPAYELLSENRVVFRNTAIGLGRGEGRYLKRRLVPFGEYVPLEGLLRGAIEFFDLPMSRAEPGPWRQAPLTIDGASAQMAICYEIVFPDLVRAPVADVLLTISNDTWFGASIGPLQHQQMARMRALENGRWLLRGTNNGVTAIIDHRGEVTARLPQFEAGVLTGTFHTMTGRTPYSRFGNWPFLAVLSGLALLALGLRKRAE